MPRECPSRAPPAAASTPVPSLRPVPLPRGPSPTKIVVDDLSGPRIAAFLQEHIDEMLSVTPVQSKHALDLDALRRPGITLWSATDDERLVITRVL